MRDLRRSPVFNKYISDIELVGLIVGLRPVAKKEGPDADALMTISGQLENDGFFIRRNDRTGCAYLSKSPDLVDRLLDMENREISGGDPRQRIDTIYQIGSGLGYPECCARKFASYRTQDDTSVMDTIIARELAGADEMTVRRVPWQLNFLPPMTGPVFWYPCTLRCSKALDLADRYITGINRLAPDMAESMKNALTGVVLTAGRLDFVMFYGNLEKEGLLTFDSWKKARDFHPVAPPSQRFGSFIDKLPDSGQLSVTDKMIHVRSGVTGQDDVSLSITEHKALLIEYR